MQVCSLTLRVPGRIINKIRNKRDKETGKEEAKKANLSAQITFLHAQVKQSDYFGDKINTHIHDRGQGEASNN